MVPTQQLTFRIHDELLAIARLDRTEAVPGWAEGRYFHIGRTPDELSVVCAQARVPADVRQVRDRVALGIAGVVPMSTVGLLAGLCAALAEVSVPVFVISTYDTDWLLVESARLDVARRALEGLGHRIEGQLPAL